MAPQKSDGAGLPDKPVGKAGRAIELE